MKILKKLNFLDWIIITAFILTVVAAFYSISPFDKEKTYIMNIYIDEKMDIRQGDICTDGDNGKKLGEVLEVSGNSIRIGVKGRKTVHGARVNRKIYLKNMPLRLYVGDFYAEARLEDLFLDS